ncbi:MAG: divergent polysaccharide deacetylase family protein [Deltaproteobacteria bacterium]|nr:divergent polysaccharide deacetylase family protein [Deltaproteobacteria bacterium]
MGKTVGGKRRKKNSSFSWGVAVAGVVIGAAALAVFLFYVVYPARPPETIVRPPVLTPKKPVIETPIPAERGGIPMLAIVIDDMGRDMLTLDALFDVGVPINVAVLPHLRRSRETAVSVHKAGWDVLLHLPMEPKGSDKNDPGRGALWTGMTPDEVRAQMSLDLDTVPFAVGVNNHMGSKFTEDEPLMKDVLLDIKKRRLFFLDSRTSANSVAGRIAAEMGVPSVDRNVFLDNERDVVSIKARIAEAVRVAKKKGFSVVIGHPYPETIAALKQTLAGINNKDARIVRLTEALNVRAAVHERGAALPR